MGLATLQEYLSDWTLEGRTRSQVADTLLALAETSTRISEVVGRGASAASSDASCREPANSTSKKKSTFSPTT